MRRRRPTIRRRYEAAVARCHSQYLPRHKIIGRALLFGQTGNPARVAFRFGWSGPFKVRDAALAVPGFPRKQERGIIKPPETERCRRCRIGCKLGLFSYHKAYAAQPASAHSNAHFHNADAGRYSLVFVGRKLWLGCGRWMLKFQKGPALGLRSKGTRCGSCCIVRILAQT